MQISRHLTRDSVPNRPWVAITISILVLILIDQFTKAVTFGSTPAARTLLSSTEWVMGLAWHIHEPNAYSHVQALLAFGLVAVACMLPIPTFAKVMWAAAAASNHVEMLARPGTIDFLAFRLGETVWVANVADLYFVVGTLSVSAWMTQRIRTAESWHQPVTA